MYLFGVCGNGHACHPNTFLQNWTRLAKIGWIEYNANIETDNKAKH
jgi:hypothetical protein